jgi:hypothetical protein
MNALTRYLTDLAQAKTGIGSGVLVGYATQAVLALATAILGLLRYSLSSPIGSGSALRPPQSACSSPSVRF